MSAANIAASLKAAEEAIKEGEFKAALSHCKAALKADRNSADALLLIGQAAYHIKEYEQAELAYRRALEAKPDLLAAWEGLAELFATTNNVAGEIEANSQLLQQTSEEDPRDRAARIRLAKAYAKSGSLDNAIQQYAQILNFEPTGSPQRLDLLCELADVMLRRDEAAVHSEVQERLDSTMDSAIAEESHSSLHSKRNVSCLELDILAARAVQDSESGEASVFMVLSEIAETAPPAAKYLSYREEYIRRCLLRIFHASCRSTERQQFRLAALRECVAVITHGGATSPLPYEAAVWLLEEEEEMKGGQVPVGGQEVGGTQAFAGGVQAGAEGHIGAGRHDTVTLAAENFSRRMMHQFPWQPTARVCLALMLRRHAMHAHRPRTQQQRRTLERLLRNAMEDDTTVDCASGFKALAELQYENRNYEDAVQTSMRGLRWLQQRRERGHEALTQVALGLRLVLAKSLRRLDRLDEAERHFKALAGWVTEGEAAFSEMCGSTPTSIHQQALRGIALVSLARGDYDAARAQYERILGKAALGRGPAEHWAHADYGWLMYQDGDMQCARVHLERALKVAEEEGCAVTDSQLAEHHFRLGEVYWKMRGRYRTEKQFAYNQFLEAAKVEGHAQAPALAALGRYFEQVEKKQESAQRCFKKALAIDPNVDIAGDGLTAHLLQSGREDAAIALCREVAARAPQAVWALRRLGYLLLDRGEHSEAISALQAALRVAPSDASAWEALGAAYQPLGRLTAALKAYGRALELDSTRLYSLIQSGNLYLTLGDPTRSLQSHEKALLIDDSHPSALLGASQALTISAGRYIQVGALVAAAKELQKAAEFAAKCAKSNANLVSSWKQLGDTYLLARSAPPSLSPLETQGTSPESVTLGNASTTESAASEAVDAFKERILAVQKSRTAFLKSLHLDPSSATAWHDVACTYYHETQLQQTLSTVVTSASREMLAQRAERCLRAALRLDPANAELWAALGVASPNLSVKEFALSRSLQLDPRSSNAWVALARLYINTQQPALAERCLQQGRSQDPAVGLIWEAMSALSALSSSPAAEKERIEYAEHAVGLGAGAEGLLAFAEAALRGGKIADGGVYAAAYRAAALEPLNPAAMNVWGLACESKGDAIGATKAYKTALDLLFKATFSTQNDSLQQQHHPPASHTGLALLNAVKLNLARALSTAGLSSDAVALYGELEFEGVLDDQAHALLSYAAVRATTGDLQGAEYCAGLALSAAVDGDTAAAAVEVLLQLKNAMNKPEEVLKVLQTHLQKLQSLKAPAEDVKKLWIVAMAGAAVVSASASSPDLQLVQETLTAATTWAVSTDQEEAEFYAKLQALQASAATLAGQKTNSVALLAKAVHTCPSSKELRLSLATAARDATQGYSSALLRLLRSISMTSTAPPELQTSLLEVATAALLDCGLAAGVEIIRKNALAAAKSIHANPEDANKWYLAALLAAQVAAMDQTLGAHKHALSLGRCAWTLVDKESAKTDDSSSLKRVRLLVCISEALLRLGGEDRTKEALHSALLAVETSFDEAAAAAKTDVLRQVARCHWSLGDISQAQAFYMRAMEEATYCGNLSAGAVAAMELAHCLEASGRGRDAAQVLADEASRLQTSAPTTMAAISKAESRQAAGLVRQLLLHRTLTLARLGELESAKSAAQEATGATNGGGDLSRGFGLVAQGAVCLQQAMSLGVETEVGLSVLGEARRALSEAIQKGQDGVVTRALLGQVEYSGNLRKKAERIANHVEEALHFAEKPIVGELFELLGRLQGSKTMCAKAVHLKPWQMEWWPQLQLQGTASA